MFPWNIPIRRGCVAVGMPSEHNSFRECTWHLWGLPAVPLGHKLTRALELNGIAKLGPTISTRTLKFTDHRDEHEQIRPQERLAASAGTMGNLFRIRMNRGQPTNQRRLSNTPNNANARCFRGSSRARVSSSSSSSPDSLVFDYHVPRGLWGGQGANPFVYDEPSI